MIVRKISNENYEKTKQKKQKKQKEQPTLDYSKQE